MRVKQFKQYMTHSVPMPNELNRELGVLAFNERVLAQAEDPAVPLLERLRFLAIVSNNLDEFFEVRVAGVKEVALSDSVAAIAAAESLQSIYARTKRLVTRQYKLLNQDILPALRVQGIAFHPTAGWNLAQRQWAKAVFDEQIEPLLTPIALDRAHPFPRVLNKSLNFIVELEGQDIFGREAQIAIVQAPRTLPRVMQVPPAVSGFAHGLCLLTSIVQGFVDRLFPGLKLKGVHQFRVTRDSDLDLVEGDLEDLRDAVEDELTERHFGKAVRLEVSQGTPNNLIQMLLQEFGLNDQDCYAVDGPVNLMRLQQVIDMVNRKNLKHRQFLPTVHPAFLNANFFDEIRRRDILLHHPYESFSPVMEFLRSAATDPKVVAISQTIYRTGADSALMQALIAAARSGKEVTVVLELMARFDEEANMNWADRLERVGAHVVYGVVGHKTHAKMAMIVRRESGKLRRYVHLGTGNYHPNTAKVYEDFSLFTCDPEICEDVHKVFRSLTGMGVAQELTHLIRAPFDLHDRMLEAIQIEINHARAGKPARIAAKMNSLLETGVIKALYAASQAGVRVDLIVRGVCALRPGVVGLSDNIRVRSIVGRFLEHSRVFYFLNDGAHTTMISSADWMDRNFFRRVELAVELKNPDIALRVLQEGIEIHLLDNVTAWQMQSDGRYERVTVPAGQTPLVSQWALMAHLGQSRGKT